MRVNGIPKGSSGRSGHAERGLRARRFPRPAPAPPRRAPAPRRRRSPRAYRAAPPLGPRRRRRSRHGTGLYLTMAAARHSTLDFLLGATGNRPRRRRGPRTFLPPCRCLARAAEDEAGASAASHSAPAFSPRCRRAVFAPCSWAGRRPAAASCPWPVAAGAARPGGSGWAGANVRVPPGRGKRRLRAAPGCAFPAGAGGAGREVPNRRAGGREGEPGRWRAAGPGHPHGRPGAAAAPRLKRVRRTGLAAAAERGGSAVSLRCCSNRVQDWSWSAGLWQGLTPRVSTGGTFGPGAAATTTFPGGRAGWEGLMGEGGSCRGRQSASLSAEPGRGLGVAFLLPAPPRGRPGLLCRTPFSFPVWCESSSLHLQIKSVKSFVWEGGP